MASRARVVIESESDIVAARQKGRELAASCGFSSTDQTLIALAISELARNIVSYATRGEVLLSIVDDAVTGIQVVAHDEGPGIADVELALQDGYSTVKSLGLGLPGARRVMDDFQIDSAPGKGTTVTVRKWKR
ncbi:MAG TPA: anti-sigma regulatory factor [Polyangiaceae bacterium]|nr:anti-sigma regulatory factor [Polyangiaceae bacterium]